MHKPKSPCILYVSTFPPRECGIATFTHDLTTAIDREFNPGIKSKILALNYNGTSIYNYPRKVRWQINESDMEDYLQRAADINKAADVKLVNIQHEYGIFGGDWGNYLLPFLELLQKPVIVTFHTVLPRPDAEVKKVTRAIAEKSLRLVVMTKTAARLLHEQYGIPKNKISVIPHGVHHVAFPSKTRAKKKLNLSGRTVLSTFGMLNRDKGIEYAIEALPQIVKEYPDVLYLVIGATHPVVRREEGERYRNKLKKKIMKLGLKNHVKFYNRYLELDELIDFLRATDIYISPTLNPQQSVSGTISYALSCACPIIATANQYAKDVIAPERGILVRFRKSVDIRKALQDMLSDKKAREEMKQNAYFYSRHMTWQNVALAYFNIFNNYAKIVPRREDKYPPINLGHIRTLTDDFGMIQFATHTKPDPHSGYCLDDNARILLGCAKHYQRKKSKSLERLMEIYLNYIKFSQQPNGHFHDFISYQRTYIERAESEDSFGRAVWALGYVVSAPKMPEQLRKRAHSLLKKTIPFTGKLKSLRAISFAIIGLSYMERAHHDRTTAEVIKRLAKKLEKQFAQQQENNGDATWQWFENFFTYSNYKLPEALFRAYEATGEAQYRTLAQQSIDFLNSITFEKKEYFSPIGQDGWYFRNGKRSYFDQQPEDAASATEALVMAWRTTKDPKYRDQAQLAFSWFLGKNHLNQMVYDEATGGCYDGVGKYSINFNQGAESTISYLLARLAIEDIGKK